MSGTALLMAGGRSERMRAGGCKTHKALRTICGSSLLQHNLEALFSSGFKNVTVAVNQTEESLLATIKGLCPLAARRGASLNPLIEQKPLGTIGAARPMSDLIENLLVVNVDNLTDLDLQALFTHHVESQAALTVACHLEPFRVPFGQLEVSGSRVTGCKEKPTIPILISSGIYALSRRAMSAIPPDEKIHAPDLINSLAEGGELVSFFKHDAWWIDVNDEAALARAEAALELRAGTMAASA